MAKRVNPYMSKRLVQNSKTKTTKQDRRMVEAFRKENKENLRKGDIDEAYNDTWKYKQKSLAGDMKYYRKNVYR